MTIDLNVSRDAVVQDVSKTTGVGQREHTTAAWVGIDLSLLGVQTYRLLPGEEVEPFHYGKMIAATRAASAGGLDFVALSSEFLADTAHAHPCGDAVAVGAQLRSIPGVGVVMEVAANPQAVADALNAVAVDASSWASLAIHITDQTEFTSELCDVLCAVHRAGVGLIINLSAQSLTGELTSLVARYADMVRMRVQDPHVARGLRYGIRAAAHEAGRDLPVVADLGVIISANSQAAHERALLVEAIYGTELFAGIPKVVGTVYDVADAIERWVGLGAADGVVVLPASLPTDLGSLIRGVLPLLSGRAGVEVKPQSLI
ncbi:hypothetical protein JTE88_05425 [Arcanobacterium phocisimile]|uniref:Uncharacterized protein n=1 Tax=Arcanobacterium phocisimile TaxID=1302235 RepID=A0ABX7IEI6_9ACTO|nr:hypothetical protein [Arcanobacterium phocisimile]QRV01551.1 hypothetical protein JTE88_05425 [Arcanobacterium phocisimile]